MTNFLMPLTLKLFPASDGMNFALLYFSIVYSFLYFKLISYYIQFIISYDLSFVQFIHLVRHYKN